MQSETARTIKQTAEELGLSPATLRAWIRERRISYIRLGRAVRIPAGEIRRLIERGTVPAVSSEDATQHGHLQTDNRRCGCGTTQGDVKAGRQ